MRKSRIWREGVNVKVMCISQHAPTHAASLKFVNNLGYFPDEVQVSPQKFTGETKPYVFVLSFKGAVLTEHDHAIRGQPGIRWARV